MTQDIASPVYATYAAGQQLAQLQSIARSLRTTMPDATPAMLLEAVLSKWPVGSRGGCVLNRRPLPDDDHPLQEEAFVLINAVRDVEARKVTLCHLTYGWITEVGVDLERSELTWFVNGKDTKAVAHPLLQAWVLQQCRFYDMESLVLSVSSHVVKDLLPIKRWFQQHGVRAIIQCCHDHIGK